MTKKFSRQTRRKIFRRRRGGLGKKRIPLRFKRYVKRAIHRNMENKCRINYAANQPITTGDSTTMTYPLINAVGQNTSDDTRIGNSIRIVKGIYKGCVNLLPYNATTNPQPLPCWVKIWVVRDLKNAGQLSTMDSAAFGRFFRGNGTALGFQSNVLDTTLEVNKDSFRVLYSKMFKLGNSYSYSGGSPTNGASYFDNSPSAKHFSFNWGKWVKKQVKFDDNASYAQNANLYIVYQCIACEGSSSSGKQLVEFHYTNTMEYEDA